MDTETVKWVRSEPFEFGRGRVENFINSATDSRVGLVFDGWGQSTITTEGMRPPTYINQIKDPTQRMVFTGGPLCLT